MKIVKYKVIGVVEDNYVEDDFWIEYKYLGLDLDNGDVVQLTPESITRGQPVKAGIELLDASRNGIVDARVLKDL